MTAWDSWIGREETRADRVDAGLVARWLATFDRTTAEDGSAPQGFHWCLCTPDAATAELGRDGHPQRGESADSFLPPLPQPRRMWASSKVEFVVPLRDGQGVTRRSRVQSITEKSGGSGNLVFVEVAHETCGDGVLAVREVQTLVYRDAPAPDTAPVPPAPSGAHFDPAGWDAVREVLPAEPLLFRYSALTFNSHRIHYDAPYARNEEGYRGLVVHGPLIATLLLDLARRQLGDNALKTLAFRGLSAAICGEALHLAMRRVGAGWELCAFASDGRAVMSGAGE